MIELTLPFPPSLNAYIRHSRGMHFPTKRAKMFRAEVAAIVKQARLPKLTQRLQVTITLHPPTRVARDIDNYPKPAMDALQHAGLLADDELIDRMVIERGAIVKGGMVRVQIVPHEHQQPQQPALIDDAPPVRPLTAKERKARDLAAEPMPF